MEKMLYAKQKTPDQNQKSYFWIEKITLISIPEKKNSKHKQPLFLFGALRAKLI